MEKKRGAAARDEEERGMKRIAAMLLGLAMLLSPAGCAEKTEDEAESGGETVYDDTLIGELYSEEGEYTDAVGNTLGYAYHVPRILSETAVAAALNQEIAAALGTIVEEQKEMMAAGVSLSCTAISWESHWNESTVCLVVKRVTDDGAAGYDVFSYDFFGGRRLTGEELAARCGLTGEELRDSARRTLARYFDAQWQEALDEGGARFAARYAERRAWTLSDENINEEMALYLEEGALWIAAEVGSFAGADSEQVLLPLETEEPDAAVKTAEDRFVRAELSGQTLRVRFEETEEAARFAEEFGFGVELVEGEEHEAEGFGFDVARAYFVEGLYGTYEEVFIGSIGQGYFPYLFLRTEEGRVEYVNLLEGMTAGFLCDGGVLGGVRGIVSFETGTVEAEFGEYETVFAVDASGERHDLSGAVSDADWVLPEELAGTWSAEASESAEGSEVSDYVLALEDGGGFTVTEIVSGLGRYSEYSGQVSYLGTNGEGMVFGYRLNGDAGAVRHGAFTLLHGADDSLRVKAVAGEALFDAPAGRATVFERSL